MCQYVKINNGPLMIARAGRARRRTCGMLALMETIGDRIKATLRLVPPGRAVSYGAVAALAGAPNGARTVARILHSSAAAEGLPWWRVVRADGGIALRRGYGFEEQEARLVDEGVEVGRDGRVDLGRYGWDGAR